MKIDLEKNYITAEEGKILRRKSDGYLAGKCSHLGVTFYLHGKLLSDPLKELPSHYEEIDEPVTEDDVVIDENTTLVDETIEEERVDSELQIKKITIADYRELERKVEILLKTICLNNV